MLYASAATGFKSGGFNQLRTSTQAPSEFDDEESTNYEFGFKTSWFERMVTFNATGFYTEYKEFQAQVFDGSSINVINAGKLISYGAEADLMLVPVPGLVIGGSMGFNIAKYGSFDLGPQTAEQKWEATKNPNLPGYPDVVGSPANCSAPPSGPFWKYDPEGNENPLGYLTPEDCVQDLAGKVLDNAPKWSVTTYAQYQYLLPWYPIELFARGEYIYTSGRFLDVDLDPHLFQPSTHVVNLRLGVRAENELWEVTGWVRNLTDEGYNVVGFDTPTLSGFAGVNAPPRQYGVTVRFKFTGEPWGPFADLVW
jgi:iron complex outermembrane receptor protein